MQDFQKRVIKERNDLSVKLTKLEEALASGKIPVSDTENDRLVSQASLMRDYLSVLNDRIDAFELPVGSMEIENEISKGREIIGDFNNEGRQDVEQIKTACADLIDLVDDLIPDGRRKSIFITHIEEGQQAAVKALFNG